MGGGPGLPGAEGPRGPMGAMGPRGPPGEPAPEYRLSDNDIRRIISQPELRVRNYF